MRNKSTVPPLPPGGREEDIPASPLDFESCVKMLGGDRAMLLELLREFLGHLDIQVKAIASALAEENADAVCAVAHSIRGGAAVLSAHSLMNAAAVLEGIGKAGDLSEVEDCYLILVREIDQLRCHCKGLMNNDG